MFRVDYYAKTRKGLKLFCAGGYASAIMAINYARWLDRKRWRIVRNSDGVVIAQSRTWKDKGL